jgi:predicted helicase
MTYIYVRTHASYLKFDACKIGKASNIIERDSTYATGEIERGGFTFVISVPEKYVAQIEKMLQRYFTSMGYHIYIDGGTEFYNVKCIPLIVPFLEKTNIPFQVLTKEEIDELVRSPRIQALEKNQTKKIYTIIQQLKNIIHKYKKTLKPSNHQLSILKMITQFYKCNDIGKIIWACGLGKALLSILIVKLLKFKKIIIGVPNNYLQKQIKNEILKIFPNKKNIIFVGGYEEDGIKSTTNQQEIISFLQDDETKFVISTYHSCHLLVNKYITFDFKIGDEAHHLVGVESEHKGFLLFHSIFSKKTLFMTATEKHIESQQEKFSMKDETVFGPYIDIKTVQWAIENKKITDYHILVLKNTEDEIDKIIRSLKINVTNKELFMSCYMALKSLEKYHDLTHMLLYTNTTEDAELAKQYIDDILELSIIPKQHIYNNAIHSKNCKNIQKEVDKFKKSPYGIIPCVYIFGEGFDLPKLNGVCIASNMQSETRIVQSLLRPNRLDFENPNKKSYVITPYTDSDNWEIENKSYTKVKKIIYHLRNVDANIEQKISVCIQPKSKKEKKMKPNDVYEDYDMEENSDELHKIKLRLRYSKALGSKCSEEQDEYNYVQTINRLLGIQSKKQYVESKFIHGNFIESPEEYFKLKGVWNNWYDFMGMDTAKFIQTKQEWINFCKEKNIKSLEEYYMQTNQYSILPKEPSDFYREFTNIQNELGINTRRR